MKTLKIKKLILLLIGLLAINIAYAKDITLSVNQSEYYFLIGEEAIIPLETENTYKEPIEGTLSYTLTQEVKQAGFQYTNSNTQSPHLTIPINKETIDLGFGTADSPSKLKVYLSFSYKDKAASLEDIIINFVSDEDQKKQNNEKKQSSSEQQKQAQQNQEQKQNLEEQMKQMQEQMNNIFKNQEPQKQTAQQKVQNNQMTQDSAALKQEMQRQMEEQRKIDEEFVKQISQKEKFQKQHQELLNEGYKQSSASVDATNETTGNFEVNYEKQGETASLKGSMENGEIKDMQKTSSEDIKKMMENLKNNEKFQKFDQKLQKQGLSPLQPEIEQQGNITNVKIHYEKDNQTAAISAIIENNEIKEIKLENGNKNYWWIWLLIILFLSLTGFFVYNKYFKKKSTENEEQKTKTKPINYRKEAKKLLEEAKKLFKDKKEKDAYGKAAEAIRFYYSHKLEIKTELTNSNLITSLKKHKIPFEKTQKCLNLCGLVEFARYKANKEDFDEIINLADKIIK